MSNDERYRCLSCRFDLCKSGNIGDTHRCGIRDVLIRHPMFTDCFNGHIDSDVPEGPIFSLRFYSPDRRIPWHGPTDPRCTLRGDCLVCGRPFRYGVLIQSDDKLVGKFCCNRHYVQWWKENHPFEELRWDYEWEEPRKKSPDGDRDSNRRGHAKIAGTTASEIFYDLIVLTDYGHFGNFGFSINGVTVEIDSAGKKITMEEVLSPLMAECDAVDPHESAKRLGIVFGGAFKPLYEIMGDSEIVFRAYSGMENLPDRLAKLMNVADGPAYEFAGMVVEETTVRFVDDWPDRKGPQIVLGS